MFLILDVNHLTGHAAIDGKVLTGDEVIFRLGQE
jgi:hypothetical protein